MLNSFFLCLLLFCYSVFSELQKDDEEDEQIMGESDSDEENEIGAVNIIVDTDNTTRPVDRSDEEWVKDAVLDVAYYLRAHKFNDFDRRYYMEGVNESYQHKHFPDPPLRYLHWEVSMQCEKGFYECLAYLQDTVLKAELVRSLDTNVVMNERHWEFPRNAKSIEKLDQECNRLKAIDWRDADPFKGPLERFQWRVSASYFMCFFTMQDLSPLTMFGERCDNFASCLDGKEPFNNDPRGDDSLPYQCAMYSFCPEVCCPQKKIGDLEECLDYTENPCYSRSDRSKRICTFKRDQNQDFNAVALNQWNVTCLCDSGYEWMSMFGICVDIDECSTGAHTCTPMVQTCVNLKGHYACVCAWGFLNVSGTCVPNKILIRSMTSLNEFYHTPSTPPPRPFSLFHSLFRMPGKWFKRKKNVIIKSESPNKTNAHLDLNIDLDE